MRSRRFWPARDGSLWVGQWNGGLTRLKEGVIEVYGPKDGLTQTQVSSLAEDRWGSIWIGTRKGLFVLRGETAARGRIETGHEGSRFTRSCAIAKARSGPARFRPCISTKTGDCLSIAKSTGSPIATSRPSSPHEDGGLWIGMNGGGLARFCAGKVVARYGVAEGLPSDDVTSVCESRDGTVWIGTWGEGLHRLKDGKITPVPVGEEFE